MATVSNQIKYLCQPVTAPVLLHMCELILVVGQPTSSSKWRLSQPAHPIKGTAVSTDSSNAGLLWDHLYVS